MSETLTIPEAVFCALMLSWLLMVIIALGAGYWLGRSHEMMRRMR